MLRVLSRRLYSTATAEKWDLYAGVLVERLPVISKTLSPVEKEFQDQLWKIEYENSLKSDHEMQHEKDVRQAQLLKKGEVEVDLDEISSQQTAQDKKDAYIEEHKSFEFAPRITTDDKADNVKSTNRKLEDILYLIVEQKLGTDSHMLLPQGKREDGESLRQTAERVLKTACGDQLKPTFYGNAPVGFYKYKYPSKARKESVGAKVFFFRSSVQGSEGHEIKEGVKFEWQDKMGLEKKLSGGYSDSVQKFLF
ncbi:MRPL46 family protein [Megaselia abdita]